MHRLMSLKYDSVMAELWGKQRAVHYEYHPNNKLRDYE